MDFTVRSARGTARPRLSSKFRVRTLVPAAACVATLSMATTHVEAVAQESPLTAIVSEISRHEVDIDRINRGIGKLREAVNQALVDLHDAQSHAEQARQGATEARKRLDDTQAEVERAQDELDQISRSSYRSSGAGGASVHADADARKDSLDRKTYLRKESEDKQRALEDLQRARTEAANDESTLRQASRLADDRAAAAEEAEEKARTTLDDSLSSLDTFLAERDTVSTELEEAKSDLAEQRPEAAAAMGIGVDGAEGAAAGTEGVAPDAAPTPETETPDAPEQPTTESETDTPETAAEESADTQTESESATEPETATEAESEPEGETEAEAEAEAEVATEAEPDAESSDAEAPAESANTEDEPADAGTADAGSSDALSSAGSSAPSLEEFANPDTVQAALDAFAKAVGETQADHTSFEDPYADSEDGESGASGIAAPSSSESADASVAETDEEEGTNVADVLPDVDDAEEVSNKLRGDEAASDGSREQQIEAVIARAESQIGTPYVWGGGDANGATMGLDGQGYNGQAGYDCSGLVLYAFSGAGISLPHYTGYQYQRGTQIPVDEAERGDLLFWGNGGNQHVAIYLGDGMMLEAPQTGMNVQKTAVRRSGMAPMAVRLI
ncbi:DIP1281 family NlpC/P60 protein [Corynebacterium sp. p3-SID1194]|uniref:DIP1281 family NlpC/P60 protein n=1 Tax=Corynebacterium sp. p3-SID1194 TaxID=2916105 RepID=UPI0021A82FAB|nr:NlpC/P60 family protein [Corynebacterium sp. p3-SID1194]MCT1449211.1 NlpC/P60 family protein [Corynebacterium sp. p3-SID1194]